VDDRLLWGSAGYRFGNGLTLDADWAWVQPAYDFGFRIGGTD